MENQRRLLLLVFLVAAVGVVAVAIGFQKGTLLKTQVVGNGGQGNAQNFTDCMDTLMDINYCGSLYNPCGSGTFGGGVTGPSGTITGYYCNTANGWLCAYNFNNPVPTQCIQVNECGDQKACTVTATGAIYSCTWTFSNPPSGYASWAQCTDTNGDGTFQASECTVNPAGAPVPLCPRATVASPGPTSSPPASPSGFPKPKIPGQRPFGLP